MSKLFVKRTFVIVSPTAITSPDFPPKGVAGSTGRLDVIARSILSALKLSKDKRENIVLKALLLGPPNPPLLLEVYGRSVKENFTNELEVIEAIRKTMKGLELDGFHIRRIDFKKLLEEVIDEHERIYYLKENGKIFTRSIKPAKTIAFILGSHVDIPLEYEGIMDRMNIERISLGSISYLTSQCIVIVNWLLDNYGKGVWRALYT